jgi:regulatory protein
MTPATIVTAIIPSTRREGRFEVMVDGRPGATLGLDAIDKLQLHVGRELSDVDRAAVEHEAGALRTVDRALDMLALRARSTRELRRQLLRKGEPEEFVVAAIERLVRLGVLDDASYARQLARSKMLGSGHSARRLQSELFRKGVDRRVADEAIAEVTEEEEIDPQAILEGIARKKLASLGKLDPLVRRRRLYAFLARRGYASSDIMRILDRILSRGATESENREIEDGQ